MLVGKTGEKNISKIFMEIMAENGNVLDLYRLYLASCKYIKLF